MNTCEKICIETNKNESSYEDSNLLENDDEIAVNKTVDEVEEILDSEVVCEGINQEISIEQQELIEQLKERKIKKEKKEKITSGVKLTINILWIIFGGIWTSLYVIISGIFECITLVGIHFGIILFKLVPFVFMPVGKRIKTNYGEHPVLNTLWLIFGGGFVALSCSLWTIALFTSIIGIPIALQTWKISKLLWSPFGAQVLEDGEFSSVDVEKDAYTIQFIRKNKILIQSDKYNFDEKEYNIIEKICNLNNPVHELYYDSQYSKSVLARVLTPIIIIILVGIMYIITVYFYYNLIQNFIDSGPFHYELFTIIITLITIIIMSYLLISCLFIITFRNYVRSSKPIDYGYATRKELAKYHDSGAKLNKKTKDLIYVLYKSYEKEILTEIIQDRK